MKKQIIEAVNSLEKKEYEKFAKWVRGASKMDMLDAIEYYSGNIGSRHIIINEMRYYLKA